MAGLAPATVGRRAAAGERTGFVPMHLEPLRPSRRIQAKEHRRHLPASLSSLSWRFLRRGVFGCFCPRLRISPKHGTNMGGPAPSRIALHLSGLHLLLFGSSILTEAVLPGKRAK